MEQIQQHEWEKVGVSIFYTACKHCDCGRLVVNGETTYELNGSITSEEPACITRTINAPASDKAEG